MIKTYLLEDKSLCSLLLLLLMTLSDVKEDIISISKLHQVIGIAMGASVGLGVTLVNSVEI